jgi:hypothetical protein
MILIPYFSHLKTPDWLSIGVFLCEGGRTMWSVDDTDTDAEITEMLLENGFPVEKIEHMDGVIYARIDYGRIKMAHFYQWHEIDPTTSENDVWRSFSIPRTLWSCPVFKDHFWKTSGLPIKPMGVF